MLNDVTALHRTDRMYIVIEVTIQRRPLKSCSGLRLGSFWWRFILQRDLIGSGACSVVVVVASFIRYCCIECDKRFSRFGYSVIPKEGYHKLASASSMSVSSYGYIWIILVDVIVAASIKHNYIFMMIIDRCGMCLYIGLGMKVFKIGDSVTFSFLGNFGRCDGKGMVANEEHATLVRFFNEGLIITSLLFINPFVSFGSPLAPLGSNQISNFPLGRISSSLSGVS